MITLHVPEKPQFFFSNTENKSLLDNAMFVYALQCPREATIFLLKCSKQILAWQCSFLVYALKCLREASIFLLKCRKQILAWWYYFRLCFKMSQRSHNFSNSPQIATYTLKTNPSLIVLLSRLCFKMSMRIFEQCINTLYTSRYKL